MPQRSAAEALLHLRHAGISACRGYGPAGNPARSTIWGFDPGLLRVHCAPDALASWLLCFPPRDLVLARPQRCLEHSAQNLTGRAASRIITHTGKRPH